jgi:hypothetical protein
VADTHNRIEAGRVDVTANRRGAVIEANRIEHSRMLAATREVYG